MSPGQRENSSLVIKGRWIPSGRGMALGTVVIKVVGHMVWIGDSSKPCLVTTIAIGCSAGIAGGMTIRTRDLLVGTSQGETALAMIKRRR